MATELALSQITAKVNWAYNNVDANIGNTTFSNGFQYGPLSTSNGTGSGKNQKMYAAYLTITAGSTSTIDLSGSLTDNFGTSLSFTKVKLLYVEHLTTAASAGLELEGLFFTKSLITGQSSDPIKLVLPPGGCFFLNDPTATGYTVTNSTADTLTLKNTAAASVNVRVFVAGE